MRYVAVTHEVRAVQVCPSGRADQWGVAGPQGGGEGWLGSSCSHVWSVAREPGKAKLRSGFIQDWPALRRAVSGALTTEYDVIWGHSANWAYFLPRECLGRTVLDVQDCYDLSYRRHAAVARNPLEIGKAHVKRLLYRRFAKRYLRHVRTIVMVNAADADSVGSLIGREKVRVVPNGVEADWYRRPVGWQPVRDAPLIVFTGAMSTSHNDGAALFFARRVFPHIRKQVPRCRFVAVGKSPSRRLLEVASSVPGVLVTGLVADVRPYLWDATVYVAPMLSGTGLKNKILEAWAAGCAVVSTSLGCEALETRAGENILIADTPDELLVQIMRVLKKPELRETLGRSARDTVLRSYRWETRASQFQELLMEAAQHRSQGRGASRCA